MRDPEGRPLRLVGINHDITARKKSEEHVQLLMCEISHRAKNLMSVVQVMARRSASEADPAAFSERFGERIADARLEYLHTGAVWEVLAPAQGTIADEPQRSGWASPEVLHQPC